ncbi:DUF3413 domain-containing protein [Chromatiaceae bacterium AAb-1]|nr:DUF3413 domain-containing protein [Chromatiaceae bacterium AAb-1]
MVLENNLSLVKKVNRLLNWGHWFSCFNILLTLLITSVYWLSEPSPQTLLGWSYLLLNWVGHTAFLCFMFFILTIFPVSLVFPYQRHVRGMAAILATIALVVLIFDAYVYASLGYHIGSTSLEQAVDLLRQQVVTNLRNFILIVLVVAALLLTIELILSNFCWKKVERLKQSGLGQPLFIVFTGSFMLSHLLHIHADANLKWDITKQDNVLPLSYPATAKTFLARYQLVDLAERAEKQLERLSLPDDISPQKNLQCTPEQASSSTLLLVTGLLSPEQRQWFDQQRFRQMEQHFSPSNSSEALLNLLYGQFMNTQQSAQLLASPPGWLKMLPEGLVSIHRRQPEFPAQLSWLTSGAPLTSYAIVFDKAPEQHWQDYQHYQQIAVIQLSNHNTQFSLTPSDVRIRWPRLQYQHQQHVTQHLDWLPTLMAQAGCTVQNHWLGDNLLQPRALPKLNISQQQLISFKKDKMVILRPDGSFGVWSAGTLVPLDEKLDLPMLTDALKRIEHQPGEKHH